MQLEQLALFPGLTAKRLDSRPHTSVSGEKLLSLGGEEISYNFHTEEQRPVTVVTQSTTRDSGDTNDAEHRL